MVRGSGTRRGSRSNQFETPPRRAPKTPWWFLGGHGAKPNMRSDHGRLPQHQVQSPVDRNKRPRSTDPVFIGVPPELCKSQSPVPPMRSSDPDTQRCAEKPDKPDKHRLSYKPTTKELTSDFGPNHPGNSHLEAGQTRRMGQPTSCCDAVLAARLRGWCRGLAPNPG